MSGGTQALELWASAEVCAALDWTRAKLKIVRERDPSFPEPLGVVSKGTVAVWDAAAVRAWWWESAERKGSRAWRRAEAVRLYRAGGVSVADIAAQLRANPDSIRRWLRSAGELLPRERAALEAPDSPS